MNQSHEGLVLRTYVGLKPGDSGPAVGALQRYLGCFGYLPLEATLEERPRRTLEVAVSEVFDEQTLEGLRAYQAFNGLPVTGLLDEVSVDDMEGPRCGFPDVLREDDVAVGRMRYSLSGREWHRHDLRYAFENFSSDSTTIRIQRAVSAAFRVWSEVTPLTFHRLPSISEHTEIELRFIPGQGGQTLAYAYYPPDGDITFYDGYTWNTSSVVPKDQYDLQTVATHEIGHALGLQHSTVHGSVMRPRTQIGRAVRVLHQDDVNGIQAKYGPPEPTTPGQNETTVPDVQELRPATAAERVRAASLRPVFSGSDGPNAWVWRQSPRARKIVSIDSEVTMQLRNGPRL